MHHLRDVAGAPDDRHGVFGSRTITAHLIRGTIAVGSLIWAANNWSAHPDLGILAIALALVAMRGCPMCWTVGLFETIAARVKRNPTAAMWVSRRRL